LTGVDEPAPKAGSSWLLRIGYVVLIVAALAFVTLVVGEVIAAIETGEHPAEEEGGLHHLFIFDWAWPIALVTSFLTLVAGIVTLIGGWVRGSWPARRYGLWALAYSVVALVVFFTVGGLEL
jgi:hypothetical protein